MRGGEGEHFVARLGNAAQSVVLEPDRTRPVGRYCGSGCRLCRKSGGILIRYNKGRLKVGFQTISMLTYLPI